MGVSHRLRCNSVHGMVAWHIEGIELAFSTPRLLYCRSTYLGKQIKGKPGHVLSAYSFSQPDSITVHFGLSIDFYSYRLLFLPFIYPDITPPRKRN